VGEIKFFTKALVKILVCWHATPCRLVNIASSLYTQGSARNAHIQSANIQDAPYIQNSYYIQCAHFIHSANIQDAYMQNAYYMQSVRIQHAYYIQSAREKLLVIYGVLIYRMFII